MFYHYNILTCCIEGFWGEVPLFLIPYWGRLISVTVATMDTPTLSTEHIIHSVKKQYICQPMLKVDLYYITLIVRKHKLNNLWRLALDIHMLFEPLIPTPLCSTSLAFVCLFVDSVNCKNSSSLYIGLGDAF